MMPPSQIDTTTIQVVDDNFRRYMLRARTEHWGSGKDASTKISYQLENGKLVFKLCEGLYQDVDGKKLYESVG